MSRTLKTLLTIILIVMGAMWLLTVYRSCDTKDTTARSITDNISSGIDDTVSEGVDKLEDLYEDEDDEGASEGESTSDDTSSEGDAGDSESASGAADGDDTGDSDEKDDTAEYEADDDVSVAGSGVNRNGGEYLVVAGAYISKSNAKKYQKQLSKKGYDSEIRVFLGSDYHSVIIGQYASRGEAIRVADKIGGEAYAHKKRYPKKRR